MATTDQLTALAGDGSFRQRVRNLVLLEAAAVCAEVNTVPNHNARMAYAIKLISTPGLADQIADFLCARTNLTASGVTYDFAKRAPITHARDGAIRSQIATDWSVLSG